MKAIILHPTTIERRHYEGMKKRLTQRDDLAELYALTMKDHGSGATIGLGADTQRLCKSHLINKWLALKRRTSSVPALTQMTCSIKRSSQDVNENRKKRLIHSKERVTDIIPVDPRAWTPHDVRTWLTHMTKIHNLEVDPSFFQMNGRGLCLMPLKGFLFRVPDQGKLLYEDFRERLKQCLLPPENEAKHKMRPVNRQEIIVRCSSEPHIDGTGRTSPLTFHTL